MGSARKFLLVAFALCLPVSAISGQLPPSTSAPAFDVASVKPNNSGERRIRLDVQPGGRFTAVNMTLRELVSAAYPSEDGKFRNERNLVGGPAWFSNDRFDIVATAEGVGALDTNRPAEAATPADENGVERIRVMLRNLMADRFKLVLHHEARALPIYALVMARSDRAPGPDLRKSEVDCAAPFKSGRGSAPIDPAQAPCGGVRRLGPGGLVAHTVSLGIVADVISGLVDTTVLDRTGLDGRWDVRLNWTPDQAAQQGPQSGGPSIFTAVQEQLGLKLQSERGSVDVLVVDRAEPPTPD